jgi:hypothetical protein
LHIQNSPFAPLIFSKTGDILNIQGKGLVVHSFSLSLLGGMLFL